MSLQRIAAGFCRGSFVGLLLFALIAHVLLLFGSPVPSWLLAAVLPVCWVLGAGIPSSVPDAAPASRWLPWVAGTILLVVLGALTVGALATPSRHWDGVVAWDVKADHLTTMPTLEQDYFRDLTVYCHSRDYPLLQPLLLATVNRLLGDGVGRLLFPFLYLLLVVTVGTTLRRVVDRGWVP